MQYQDCVDVAQAADSAAAACLARANINPATGLATDYLNHFNEAIMLLEMIATCPDCLDDLSAWQPQSYCDHFRHSSFRGRDLAIAAYASADPAAREALEELATTMTTVIEATRKAIGGNLAPRVTGMLAERAAAWLKVLVARAGAVINGESNVAPQAAVDRLFLQITSP